MSTRSSSKRAAARRTSGDVQPPEPDTAAYKNDNDETLRDQRAEEVIELEDFSNNEDTAKKLKQKLQEIKIQVDALSEAQEKLQKMIENCGKHGTRLAELDGLLAELRTEQSDIPIKLELIEAMEEQYKNEVKALRENLEKHDKEVQATEEGHALAKIKAEESENAVREIFNQFDRPPPGSPAEDRLLYVLTAIFRSDPADQEQMTALSRKKVDDEMELKNRTTILEDVLNKKKTLDCRLQNSIERLNEMKKTKEEAKTSRKELDTTINDNTLERLKIEIDINDMERLKKEISNMEEELKKANEELENLKLDLNPEATQQQSEEKPNDPKRREPENCERKRRHVD